MASVMPVKYLHGLFNSIASNKQLPMLFKTMCLMLNQTTLEAPDTADRSIHLEKERGSMRYTSFKEPAKKTKDTISDTNSPIIRLRHHSLKSKKHDNTLEVAYKVGDIFFCYARFLRKRGTTYSECNSKKHRCDAKASIASLCPECFQKRRKLAADFFEYTEEENPDLYMFFKELSMPMYNDILNEFNALIPFIPDVFDLQTEWYKALNSVPPTAKKSA